MRNGYLVTAWDVFAVGMTHRILVGAAPTIKGATMAEKQNHLEAHFDHLRRAAVCGDANGPDLVGVLLTEAVDPRADVGVIYFVKEGYWAMCGSGTFAIGAFLIESGMIAASGPRVEIVLELMTGLMRLDVEIEGDRVVRVNTVTEPVFHQGSHAMDIAGYGEITVDVAYCLNHFEAQVDATPLGLDVSRNNRSALIDLGLAVRHAVNERLTLVHPENPHIGRLEQTLIYEPIDNGAASEFRNVAIYGEDGFDLTPSGTSTCALMATRHAHGEIGVGEGLRMRSVTDAVIDGRIEAEARLGDFRAIVPRISGTGSIARQTTVFA